MRTAPGRGAGAAGRSARRQDQAARRDHRRRWTAVTIRLAAAAAAAAAVLAVGAGCAAARALAAGVAVAGAGLAWAARPEADPHRWGRGAAGEEATAVLLDVVPGPWAVLHDRRVPGTRANIDHLVIGRRRIWVVDSKAYRGRLRSTWRGVRAGDRLVDTGPAAWEAEVAAERLGRPVRPLVVVHGHGLRRRRRTGGVPVVPAHRLVAELRRRDRGVAPRRSRRRIRVLAQAASERLPPA